MTMQKMQYEKASPKMTRRQAKLFWNSLTPDQRIDFNKMMKKMSQHKLELTNVTVDDNEQIQRITLEERKRT